MKVSYLGIAEGVTAFNDCLKHDKCYLGVYKVSAERREKN